MARATGIQITDNAVRIAEIDGSPRKFKVLGADEVPLPFEGPGRPSVEELSQAIKTALKDIKAKKEFVVLGLPASEAVIREIVVPFTEPEQIRRVIKFESEAHLPTLNIDEVVVGWHKVAESGPRSRLVIFAVPKATIQHYLDAASKAGIEPSQVDLDCAALFSLTRLLPDLKQDEEDPRSQVVVDLGEKATTVMVIRGEHLRMVRSIRIGSDSMVRSLTSDLGIAPEEARRVTREALLGGGEPFALAAETEASAPSAGQRPAQLQKDIVQDRQNEFARRLINEIRRTLSSIQIEGGMAGIWLTGPASHSVAVEHALADEFEVPVHTLDPLQGADHSLSPQKVRLVGASVGLALKALEHDPVGLEFRQEEFRYARKFDRIAVPLLVGVTIIFFCLAFLAIGEVGRARSATNKAKFLAEDGRDLYKEFATWVENGRENEWQVLGFNSIEEIHDIAARANNVEDHKVNSALLSALNEPMGHILDAYGVIIGDVESMETPPEQTAISSRARTQDFLAAVAQVRERIKPFTIDYLKVGQTEVRFTLTLGPGSADNAFELLKGQFSKMPGYEDAAIGTSRPRGDTTVYENCTIKFRRDG